MMVNLDILLLVVILILDFALSIWNAYASGYNIGMLRKQQNKSEFANVAAWSGVGLAFAGITYVLLVVLAYIAAALGYIDATTAGAVLGFDQIVFGLMIIGFGLMITIQSVIIAAKRKNIMSIIVAVFNVAMEALNIYVYISSFQDSLTMVKGIAGNKNDQQNTVILVILAILIGFFVTRAAYEFGLKKATEQQNNPQKQNRRGGMFGNLFGSNSGSN